MNISRHRDEGLLPELPDRVNRACGPIARPLGVALGLLVLVFGCFPWYGQAAETPDSDSALRREAHAQATLAEVQARRATLQREWLLRERQCYERQLVNSCLGTVDAERRQKQAEMTATETAARQVLRDVAAARRDSNQAKRWRDTLVDRQARDAVNTQRVALTMDDQLRTGRAAPAAATPVGSAAPAGAKNRQTSRQRELESRRDKNTAKQKAASGKREARDRKLKQHEDQQKRRQEKQAQQRQNSRQPNQAAPASSGAAPASPPR